MSWTTNMLALLHLTSDDTNPNYFEYLNQIETAVKTIHQGVVNLQFGRGQVTSLCDDKPESSAPTGSDGGIITSQLKVRLKFTNSELIQTLSQIWILMLINLSSEGRRMCHRLCVRTVLF